MLGVALAGCGPSIGDDDSADIDAGVPCVDGATRCSGNDLQTCQSGEFVTSETCPEVCATGLGCVLCQPGTGTCDGDMATTCRPDGSAYDDIFCDPVQGMSCDVDVGVCTGACSPQALGRSYIGCEYLPTVTGQGVNSSFQFAVVVSNAAGEAVTVTIEDGALSAPITFQLAPNSVAVQELPWVASLKLCNDTNPLGCGTPSLTPLLAPRGAYHLRTTGPVTVYQFSPLDYTDGVNFTYTNDASLLLPTNALTGRYVVATFPYWPDATFPSQMAVTAARDGTPVTITTSASVPAGTGTPAFSSGVPQSLTLNRGDVVELLTVTGDLTGTLVEAGGPVQVLGAHYGIFLPDGVCCADHLEESMFPIETLSTDYLITAPAVPAIPAGKARVVRIIATQPNTTLTYDPPIAGAPSSIAAIGGFVELSQQAGDFAIRADHKILVSETMLGQEAGGGTGDPAQTIAVPVDQYRTEYLFHAPTNYEVNYVNVTAPTGAQVTLDGAPATGFAPIGASGYSAARVQLGAGIGGNGDHTASSNEPFGISVYGYGQYTSYWYPGGLDLENIPIE
jgi:hypothetical protein